MPVITTNSMPLAVIAEPSSSFVSTRRPLSRIVADRQTYRVALVTISNGANNLSIYIPLFASLSGVQILISIPVLYGFIVLWLFLCFHLSRAPGIALVLNRHAPSLLTFILIWLGYRILQDSGMIASWPFNAAA